MFMDALDRLDNSINSCTPYSTLGKKGNTNQYESTTARDYGGRDSSQKKSNFVIDDIINQTKSVRSKKRVQGVQGVLTGSFNFPMRTAAQEQFEFSQLMQDATLEQSGSREHFNRRSEFKDYVEARAKNPQFAPN